MFFLIWGLTYPLSCYKKTLSAKSNSCPSLYLIILCAESTDEGSKTLVAQRCYHINHPLLHGKTTRPPKTQSSLVFTFKRPCQNKHRPCLFVTLDVPKKWRRQTKRKHSLELIAACQKVFKNGNSLVLTSNLSCMLLKKFK